MSIDRKVILAVLVAAAALSACTEPEPFRPQAAQSVDEVPLPNVDYYLPPAFTTRANASTVPIGPAICPTVTRFGTPLAGAATPGCIFR
jgi:hypothetical protein